MGRKQSLASVLAASLCLLFALLVNAESNANKSSSENLFWATTKEEEDFVRKPHDNSTAVVNEHDEFNGAFSSLDGMLQWAIGHSDPAKLKDAAQDVQKLSSSDLRKRQMEIKELMETLKMPSDAELMQIAIDDLNNSSLSVEDRHHVLQELLILVEQIDNANVLNKLGGLTLVIEELTHPNPDNRRLAAWIIGKASQNNHIVQKQVLEYGALSKLMKMVRSDIVEEATKAFYAISSLIRNNFNGHELFYAEAGVLMLQEVLSNSSIDIRLRKKAILTVSDLVVCELENENQIELPFFSNHLFLKSVVDLIASTDIDLQEKALYAIKNLLLLRATEAMVFKTCRLDDALERMEHQLRDLMKDGLHREYAMDVERLRGEVELILLKKLEKQTLVPTRPIHTHVWSSFGSKSLQVKQP